MSKLNGNGSSLVVDGIIGSRTISEINKLEPRKLFDIFQKNRIVYYNNLADSDPTQREFLTGWLRRVNRIKFRG